MTVTGQVTTALGQISMALDSRKRRRNRKVVMDASWS